MAITTEFIEKYINLIDANQFEELYARAWRELTYTTAIGQLTQMFVVAGINPLEYMTSIPVSYYDTYEGPTPPPIPQTIEEIKAAAFFDSNIKEIVVPGSVKHIHGGAFDYALELETVTFEYGVTYIPTQCFIDCPELQVVTLPITLEYIDHHAFNRCPKLTELIYLGSVKEWECIDLSANAFTDSYITLIRCTDGGINI